MYSKSLVDEIRELTATNGKPLAAQAFNEARAAKKFPETDATDLDGTAVKLPQMFDTRVTLVAVSFRQIGHQALASWIEPLARRVVASSRARNHTKIVQLTIIETPLVQLFRSWILAALRRTVESDDPLLVYTKFVRLGDAQVQRETLEMGNRLAGYVYLVDHDSRVRFRASGKATEEELDLLFDQTVRLVAEREKHRL